MNNNSSKQILLSVIGVAILVIAVVGVSFAFFSYSKTGETNNVITTGSISFAYNENNNIVGSDGIIPISPDNVVPQSLNNSINLENDFL